MARRNTAATPAIAAAQQAGIEFEIHTYDHDPASDNYGIEAATALGLDPTHVFKTLLAEVDGTPVCAMVPVSSMLSLKALASAHGGKRAVMMDADRAQRLTGYVLGGISPLGQRSRTASILDASAMSLRTIYVSAGRRGMEISLSPHDLITLTGGKTATIMTTARASDR
jgi:Cys-tRNA(Pro)/Cys-tRNA(Cys) deacylase